jgi:hypothetical protein
MKNSNKLLLTLLLVTSTLSSFAYASQNGGSRMISGALAGLILYGGIALYNSYKNKKK